MPLFIFVALFVWTALNSYAAWRLSFIASTVRVPGWMPWLFVSALWLGLPVGLFLRTVWPRASAVLSVASLTWLGVVVVDFFCFFVFFLV